MPLAEWIMEWYRMFGEPRWKSNGTRTVHLCNIENHIIPAIGNEMLQKLDTRYVQNFLDHLLRSGKKPITVHKIMEPLRGALKKAFALEMIPKNPFDHLELPTVRQDEVAHLSRPEMLALLDALPDTTHGRCCELILRTGLRKSEVAGLEWRDIDYEGQYNGGVGIIWVRRTKQYIKPIENGVRADHQMLDVKPTKSRKGYRQIPMKQETRRLFELQLEEQKRQRKTAGRLWQGGEPGALETPVFATRADNVPKVSQN
jgi:integrase